MIPNIYSWIFPAAVFAAAGFSNLTSSVKHKHDPGRAGRNRIIWFSINISISLGFLIVSAFIIDWSKVIWGIEHLYFGLVVLGVFYLGFMFKFIIGVPLVLFLAAAVLFFNIYFQDWNPLSTGDVAARFRILSNYKSEIRAEIQVMESPMVFIEGEGSSLSLVFESLIISRSMFFLSDNSYYRMINPSPETFKPEISDKIIDFLVENSFILSRNIYKVDIGDHALLYLYNIVIDSDLKNILIEN